MRFLTLLLAVPMVTAALPSNAQVNIESVLVGFTAATFPITSTGLLTLSAACQAELPNTRLCDTEEVLETRQIPSGLSGTAWVRPKVVGGGKDATGLPVSANQCDGQGVPLFQVSGGGHFTPYVNCVSEAAVACCGLPVDPAQGDLDQDGAATVRDVTILRRMLAGDPLLLGPSP